VYHVTNMSSAVQIISAHILAQFRQNTNVPLFVAVQGPQGCGKTYLTSHVAQFLESLPHSLSVAVISIDDLYLPHSKLIALAEAHPKNVFLSGRGLPGTHDLDLGNTILHELRHINEPTTDNVPREVSIPIFDKSLHSGAGDRVKGGVVKRAPVDVVIMEGWCMGFCPITLEEIDKKWSEPVTGLEGTFSMSKYRKEDIVEINEKLEDYVDVWRYFHVCIQVRTVPNPIDRISSG
jgi:D-glycerate 3-kinase